MLVRSYKFGTQKRFYDCLGYLQMSYSYDKKVRSSVCHKQSPKVSIWKPEKTAATKWDPDTIVPCPFSNLSEIYSYGFDKGLAKNGGHKHLVLCYHCNQSSEAICLKCLCHRESMPLFIVHKFQKQSKDEGSM